MQMIAYGVWRLSGYPRDFLNVYVVEDVLIDAATRWAKHPASNQAGPNMRRRLLLSLVAYVGLAVAVTLVHRSRHQVSPEIETFQRLHKGMTEEQAEAIIGRPANFRFGFTLRQCKVWYGDGWSVCICFSDLMGGGADEGHFQAGDGTKLPLRERPFWFKWRKSQGVEDITQKALACGIKFLFHNAAVPRIDHQDYGRVRLVTREYHYGFAHVPVASGQRVAVLLHDLDGLIGRHFFLEAPVANPEGLDVAAD
jgi:hypothetical protein